MKDQNVKDLESQIKRMESVKIETQEDLVNKQRMIEVLEADKSHDKIQLEQKVKRLEEVVEGQ